jgi:hypothetical protein
MRLFFVFSVPSGSEQVAADLVVFHLTRKTFRFLYEGVFRSA